MSRWVALGAAGLEARALRVGRRDIAYFKYLFESYEGVAIHSASSRTHCSRNQSS